MRPIGVRFGHEQRDPVTGSSVAMGFKVFLSHWSVLLLQSIMLLHISFNEMLVVKYDVTRTDSSYTDLIIRPNDENDAVVILNLVKSSSISMEIGLELGLKL